jgi:hypothetical protein
VDPFITTSTVTIMLLLSRAALAVYAYVYVYGVAGIISISVTPTNSLPVSRQHRRKLPSHLRGMQACPQSNITGGLFMEFIGSPLAFAFNSSTWNENTTALNLGRLFMATYNELSKGSLGDRSLTSVDFSEPAYESTNNFTDLNVPFSIVATVQGTCNSCNLNSTLFGRYLRNCTSTSLQNITIPATFCSDNATLIENSQSLKGDCNSNGPHVSDFENLFFSKIQTSMLEGDLPGITNFTSISELEQLDCAARTPFNTTICKYKCICVMVTVVGCCGGRYSLLYEA